ncbi:MAG: tetratricopeptide repeat protein [Rhodomicrobium sp.]
MGAAAASPIEIEPISLALDIDAAIAHQFLAFIMPRSGSGSIIGCALNCPRCEGQLRNCGRPLLEKKIAFEQALKLHQSGRLAEAETIYRALLEKDAMDAEALHLLGVLACQRGDVASGRQLIERSIGLNPSPESYANLANALRLLGLLLEAEDVLRKAVQLFPGDINMHVLLADDLARRGDFAAALTEYRAAIDLNPKLARSHHAIGVLYRLMGRLEEAVGAASVAIDLDPADPEAHLVLGDHLSIFSVAT